MRVISVKAFRDFCEVHPQANDSFARWLTAAEKTDWRTWADLRATFPSADLYRKCIVFNIGGNHYRVIAFVRYSRQLEDGRWTMGRIYVRNVLTHADYERNTWKAECEREE